MRRPPHFQDADQVALASSITRFARLIDHPERVLQLVDEAFRYAVGPPCGPVHLTFPMDVQRAETPADRLVRPKTPASAPLLTDPEPIVEALSASRSPLIVAGSGVWYACEGDELARFSERFSIPVVVPIWDRGSITRRIPTFMGVIGAATGGPRLLPDADCIVLAGAVPDYRLGYLEPVAAIRPDASVLRMDGGWGRLHERYEQRGGAGHAEWLSEAGRRRAAHSQRIAEIGERQAQAGLHAIHLISALQQAMTDDTVLLIDGGNIGQWAHQLLSDRYPGHWLTCGRSGVVGWGLGGAMGARLAHPDRPVILLSGDGAFTFTPAELECAARQKLPFVAIVADDEAWGITQSGHVKQFGMGISSGLGPIEFVKLAQSFGARGILARTQREVEAALETGLSSQEVTVIHAPIVGGFPGE